MNYELAKKLKDAGWPQDKRKVKRGNPKPTFPTLSALIKACGEGFFHLARNLYFDNRWVAIGGDYESPTKSTANSPEEAVANLWLELNKK